MSEKAIRVAVVGVGEFGRNHVRVWRDLPGAELVGIVDANPGRAAKVAAEFGTKVIAGEEALLPSVSTPPVSPCPQKSTLASAAGFSKLVSMCSSKSPWLLRCVKPTLWSHPPSAPDAFYKLVTWRGLTRQ